MFSHRRDRDVDLAIFLLRVGFGFSMLIFHGYGKLIGGPERWAKVGGSLQTFGIDFYPVFWGFMAAFAEFFCSAFIIMGIFFIPATFLLSVNMIVAVLFHLYLPEESPAAGWQGASHAIEYLFVYVVLMISGPGKYRINLG
ncbi:MAG: DoxX family protein [Candidatus Dadabacteria bacterium]|nr:DoxX family protein [Candidatus Dadabacteria bacterium]